MVTPPEILDEKWTRFRRLQAAYVNVRFLAPVFGFLTNGVWQALREAQTKAKAKAEAEAKAKAEAEARVKVIEKGKELAGDDWQMTLASNQLKIKATQDQLIAIKDDWESEFSAIKNVCLHAWCSFVSTHNP